MVVEKRNCEKKDKNVGNGSYKWKRKEGCGTEQISRYRWKGGSSMQVVLAKMLRPFIVRIRKLLLYFTATTRIIIAPDNLFSLTDKEETWSRLEVLNLPRYMRSTSYPFHPYSMTDTLIIGSPFDLPPHLFELGLRDLLSSLLSSDLPPAIPSILEQIERLHLPLFHTYR